MINEDAPLKGDIVNYKEELAKRIDDDIPSIVEPSFGAPVKAFLSKASKLETTLEQTTILTEPLNEVEVQIIPDSVGMIYLPWHWYANRLNKAFGIGQWTLVPEGKPDRLPPPDDLVLFGFHLIIQGCYCGFVYGEQRMVSGSDRMTYGDCIEGARSNALSRLCKHLGMAPDLHDKLWANAWRKKWAEKKSVRNKMMWQRKGEDQTNVKEDLEEDLKAIYGDSIKDGILELTSSKMKDGTLIGGKDSINEMSEGELYLLAKKLKRMKETKVLVSGGVKAEKEGGEKNER